MATSVFIGNCSSSHDLENTRREMEMSLMNGPSGTEKPTRIHSGKLNGTGGGRRKSKVNESSSTQKNKKAPQRGMGVEQLEKLRFQERIKKMTEINNPLHHPSLSFQTQQFSTLPTTTAGYGAYSILNSGSSGGVGVGQMGFDVQQSALLLQGLGNGLVHHNQGHGPVVSSGVGNNLFSEHESFLADSYAVGSLGFRGTTTETTSKELSSIPNNLKWNSDQCGVCYKKFRGNGENLTCNVSERKMCGAGEISGFGNFAKGNMFTGGNPYYGSPKPTVQEVEVMAVHRKGMNTGAGGGGSVLMEYEFFPGKVGESYCNYKELMNMASSKSVVEASDHHEEDFIDDIGVAGEVGGGGGGAAIDLSLKLSY